MTDCGIFPFTITIAPIFVRISTKTASSVAGFKHFVIRPQVESEPVSQKNANLFKDETLTLTFDVIIIFD